MFDYLWKRGRKLVTHLKHRTDRTDQEDADGRKMLPPRSRARQPAVTAALLALVLSCAHAMPASQDDDDIVALDIEELLEIDVRVVMVAGVPRGIFETPSAITVISAEDIRRTGHRSLAEAMRLAPGMFVGRSSSYNWSVGARGFSGGLANKNLVLIDGRKVYDPLFGGVFWEVQDVMLEDIDRIEVVRGPGATLWGANAMNGVINVITKSAEETQGLLVTGGGGTYERAFGSIRYGGQISENAWYRIYTKYYNRDSFVDGDGNSLEDDWSMLRGGFRMDFAGDELHLTLQGDGYGALTMGEDVTFPVGPGQFERSIGDRRVSGGNFLARLTHETSPTEGWALQAYYDRTNRRQSAGFEVRRDTFDIDFRKYFGWGDGHEFIWGLGYNCTTDRTEPGPTVQFEPRNRSLSTFSAFAQNTFTLQPERWFFMVGSKFEHNDFTGFEIQPSARLWFMPGEQHMFSGSISRPVRVPTRTEEDVFIITGFTDPDTPVGVMGTPGLRAENMIAYELGHRYRPNKDFMLETALFYHDYRRLIEVPDPVIGESFTDRGRGDSYGVEIEAKWQIADNWRVGGSYALAMVNTRGPIRAAVQDDHPQHIAHFRSYYDITDDLEFNGAVYYVDNIPGRGGGIPSYVRLDIGMTWRPTPNLEISAWGQNLLQSRHQEASFREFERGFYLRGTLRF
jgi:iron complex outermembrane recepter protein